MGIVNSFIRDEKIRKFVLKCLALPMIPLVIVDFIELINYLRSFI